MNESGFATMPVTYLDIGLAAVMLISGLLAMVRGFVREVLAIASWGLAAFAAYVGFPRLTPFLKPYISNDMVAQLAAVGAIFIGVLIIVSVITVRISDAILDSKVGIIDRTLGLGFGFARGLLIMVVAYLFFVNLVPESGRPDFVKNAKSLPVLEQTGKWLLTILPPDGAETILARLKKAKPEGADQGPVSDEEVLKQLGSPAAGGAAPAAQPKR